MTSPGALLGCISKWIFRPALYENTFHQVTRGAASVATSDAISPTLDHEPDSLYSKLNVEVRGNDPAVLKSYSWFATTAAKELGVRVGECWAPRKAQHRRMTLLKSVHIYKKHRVQYEHRTYFRHMEFMQLTGSTADTFLEYIQRNLPEGVAMKVTKHKLECLPEHIKMSGKEPEMIEDAKQS